MPAKLLNHTAHRRESATPLQDVSAVQIMRTLRYASDSSCACGGSAASAGSMARTAEPFTVSLLPKSTNVTCARGRSAIDRCFQEIVKRAVAERSAAVS